MISVEGGGASGEGGTLPAARGPPTTPPWLPASMLALRTLAVLEPMSAPYGAELAERGPGMPRSSLPWLGLPSWPVPTAKLAASAMALACCAECCGCGRLPARRDRRQNRFGGSRIQGSRLDPVAAG